jgi:uncharacterized membrane protein (UPF0127 family)
MRPLFVPLVALAFVASGCQNDPQAVTSTETHEEGASHPQATTDGATTGRTLESKATTPSQPAAADSVDNPSRLYQLRDLKRGTIRVNGQPVPVWLMDDDGKRAEGMMFLTEKEVKPEEGMLFVFAKEHPASPGFWMRNTLLPLDIIYVSRAGKVISVANGKPKDETDLPSAAPFQYVLEMRSGGAKRLHVKPGSQVEIPLSLRQATE